MKNTILFKIIYCYYFLFLFSFCNSVVKNEQLNNNNINIVVDSSQKQKIKNDFLIAIDIGHSETESGCISSRGETEFSFNKRIALLLQDELVKRGIKTYIISTSIPLRKRSLTLKGKPIKLLISVHHDSMQEFYLKEWTYNGQKLKYSEVFSGYSIFISRKNKFASESEKFANLLGKSLLDYKFHPSLHHAIQIKGENRTLLDSTKGIYLFDNLIILKYSENPAVLIECGILKNRDDEILLNNPTYEHSLILSITNAIEKFTM